VGHTWGYRNFHTNDRSKNHWLVAVLSAGEGWHNNHHAQQRSAAHGIRWFEIDLTYRTIKLLSRIGLAWDIVEPVKNERIAFEKDGA
jgi:stearoyl-CoA desaturase (delta-9 desaturase)